MTTLADELTPASPGANLPAPRILQFGAAACFLGHGMLGIDRTAAWTSYFAVVGIGHSTALTLMPWVGAFDVAMAVAVLVRPTRWLVIYMAAWTLWTALLRPLAGESAWEAVERAGNYGVPIALALLLAGTNELRLAGGAAFPTDLGEKRRHAVVLTLRLTTFALLLGHGALGLLVRKPMFVAQYAMLGLPGLSTEPLVGGFECLLALAVLLRPDRWLLFVVLGWKLASEALCPMAGAPFWVFIEHGGSYAAPLALAFLRSRAAPVASGQLASV